MRTIEKHIWHVEGGMKQGKRLDVPVHMTPFFIGRGQDCHLVVKAPGVSRKHICLELEGNTLFAKDLNSTNGTFVNHKRITGRVAIQSGDILHLGEEVLRVIRQDSSQGTRPSVADNQYESTVVMSIDDPALELVDTFVRHEEEFTAMLAAKEVAVVFQPIVSLTANEVVGYESLGRGVRADLPDSPSGLFDLAERLGKAGELSAVFRTKAVEECHLLPGTPLIFVNTHPDENLSRDLKSSIEEMRMATVPWQVVLEVHESAVTDTKMMAELKAILRDNEMYLAYDDFGAGQARWNELVEVPPDYVKFDLQLIHEIHKKSKQKQEMIRKLVDICLSQNCYPLAECVDSDEELEVCRDLGFTHGQGWLFGKGASASSFTDGTSYFSQKDG